MNCCSAPLRMVTRAMIRPMTASATPARAAMTASKRNGNCVYQRVAPTRRMMPTSVRRVYAAT
ncbi:Uncharacterised protein [Mycobacteroides abscessus subsp. abscessus]|nr:Uncharacterised protein [Mycobacteroides abscessus subsp. abscessus]